MISFHLTSGRFILQFYKNKCLDFDTKFKNKLRTKSVLTVCSYHVTYACQSESALYSCLNVKELAQNKRKIWSLSDCNRLRVRVVGCGCGFESYCSHLNFRFRACFEQVVSWHSGNYRVWILLSFCKPVIIQREKISYE